MKQLTIHTVPPRADDMSDYSAEVRFGIVMYGGVSLAIYINGVASELFEMACATPRERFRLCNDGAPGTRELYERVAFLIGSPALRERYAGHLIAREKRGHSDRDQDVWDVNDLVGCPKTRLVIDVISGTSAGGINGVFLAKALANGESFEALKHLWINEGDLGLLLNDRRSYADMIPALNNRSAMPKSLLNSDRLFMKLYNAMDSMKPLPVLLSPHAPGVSPLVEEIDLFITTTDISGSPVRLRLFDKVVMERRHKQSYRFSYPNGVSPLGNDFARTNNAFLAFASRCTSSFPFAFEPMTLGDVTRLRMQGEAPGIVRWKSFFPGLPREEVEANEHERRTFGDGGYLDNKPFSYVVETLSTRTSSVPLERKLLYVEPAPDDVDTNNPTLDAAPDAISNSIAALTSIPRYEAVREDLEAVLQRNRRIERIERIVFLGETELERNGYPQIADWSNLTLNDTAKAYGLAFLPYQRLRVFAVTDQLADRLGTLWFIDSASDQQYALRALVRVWRERRFNDNGESGLETTNAFLEQFDFEYLLRRIGFILRKIDQLTRLYQMCRETNKTHVAAGHNSAPLFSDSDRQIALRLPTTYNPLGPLPLDEAIYSEALAALYSLKAGLADVRTELLNVHYIENQRDGDSVRQLLRSDLVSIVELLLGAPKTISLELVASGTTPVDLDDAWERLASTSRTLQESVFLRAKALFNAADRGGMTKLQEALESDLNSMRVKSSGKTLSDDTQYSRISASLLKLLGSPYFVSPRDGPSNSLGRVAVENSVSATNNGERDRSHMECLNTEVGTALRAFIGEYYIRFAMFDQVSFPLYYDTGTGEPATVEVIRVSPQDATALVDETEGSGREHHRKLAGTALANFGSFLDRSWRINDVMWGRLDGAERIIQSLLPMSDQTTLRIRNELIRLAHGRILKDSLLPGANVDLVERVCAAVQKTSDGEASSEIDKLRTDLNFEDPSSRDRLRGILASLLTERGLMDYVRRRGQISSDPDPKATLDSAARAVTITGRILDGIASRRGKGSAIPRWLARFGLLLQGLVAISLPGTLRNRIFLHCLQMLYGFELLLLVLALVFASADIRTFAVTLFVITLGVHMSSLVVGDAIVLRSNWLRILVGVLVVLVLALSGAGAYSLWRMIPAWREQSAGSDCPAERQCIDHDRNSLMEGPQRASASRD